MLEQHVVVEVALFRRHDDPRDAGQRVIESGHPTIAARRDARAHEIPAIERQHDVHLRADFERSLHENQIRAAGGRRVHDRQMHARKALADRGGYRWGERGREARRRTIGRVDNMTCECQHVRCRQDFE